MSADTVPVTPERWALAIVQSEAFMWLMAGSDHVETQLDLVRGIYKKYRAAGGHGWGRI